MSLVIVGAGPNLGAAVARRFGREGMAVGLIARDRARLDALAAELAATGLAVDVAAATAVVGPMLDAGSGTILFTTGGAAVNPNPLRAGVGISFAAEVAYARMLHDVLRDRGIHVGHTAVGGRIAPGAEHEPEDVAEVLWRQHTERTEFQVRLGVDVP